MKIVIDIPERVVTAIQNGEDYRYDIHTAIAQGIPYEPKGDLISREALKECARVVFDKDLGRLLVVDVSDIDNAPTVTPKQGEWIMQEGYDGDEYYECSICKDAFTLMCGTPKDNNYNFCPNCGAEMKGGAE